LFARCQALWRRFREHCPWEKAAPKLKDADRVPDASTVRRWSRGLDCSQPAPSFLRQALARVVHWLERGKQNVAKATPSPWIAVALEVLWPLRV
jgi:hypothetical protein